MTLKEAIENRDQAFKDIEYIGQTIFDHLKNSGRKVPCVDDLLKRDKYRVLTDEKFYSIHVYTNREVETIALNYEYDNEYSSGWIDIPYKALDDLDKWLDETEIAAANEEPEEDPEYSIYLRLKEKFDGKE